MRLALVAAALVLAGLALTAWLLQRSPQPRPSPPPGAGSSGDTVYAAASGHGGDAPAPPGDVLRTPPGAQRQAAAAGDAAAAAIAALFEHAAAAPDLHVALAEVLEVGPERDFPDGEHGRGLTLQLLDGGDHPVWWPYRVLDAPLCPAASQRQFGCSNALDEFVPGQVRRFVFCRGAPGQPAAKLLGPLLQWIVAAGPVVDAPPDPVRAKLPRAIVPHLGRPACNIFRARVVEVRAGRSRRRDGRPDVGAEIDQLVVDVVELVRPVGGLKLPPRVLIAPPPFVGVDPFADFAPGSEHWFVTDDNALWQTLRASLPVAR